MREPLDSSDIQGATALEGLVRGIDHVGVIVNDIDDAAEHFGSTYGLKKGTDWTEPNGRFRLLYLESGATTLQLVQPLTGGPLAQYLASHGEGLHHVCFAVDDLDGAITSLQKATDGAPYVGGRGARVCFLADRQHGVIVELTEPITD